MLYILIKVTQRYIRPESVVLGSRLQFDSLMAFWLLDKGKICPWRKVFLTSHSLKDLSHLDTMVKILFELFQLREVWFNEDSCVENPSPRLL